MTKKFLTSCQLHLEKEISHEISQHPQNNHYFHCNRYFHFHFYWDHCHLQKKETCITIRFITRVRGPRTMTHDICSVAAGQLLLLVIPISTNCLESSSIPVRKHRTKISLLRYFIGWYQLNKKKVLVKVALVGRFYWKNKKIILIDYKKFNK